MLGAVAGDIIGSCLNFILYADIRAYAENKYGYALSRTLAQIREHYRFDVSCQGAVPEAIIAFLESGDFEQGVRKAVWLRGDADMQPAIAGSIAETFYGGVPEDIARQALGRLDTELYNNYKAWIAWLEARKN